jgi:pimeloyl-ACP methyl ester carboxylesterase
MRRRRAGIVVAVAAMTLAACSSGSSSAPVTAPAPSLTTATTALPTTPAPGTATTRPAPAGDAVYDPPSPLSVQQPGAVIWAQPFAGPNGSQGYVVLYVSSTVDGQPVAVSGVVIVPGPGAPAPPPEGRTILTWAHGTTGLGDSCAPSKQYPSGRASEEAIARVAVARGYVYAATDYQGLGTPGDHTYAVGQSAGRNVLDIARAAEQLQGSGATPASKVVVWGHSQGGGAAAFAAELAPTYAPGLDVVGAVAGAPATELTTVAAAQDGGPYVGFAFMAVVGFKAAYPSLSYDTILSAAGKAAAAAVATECSGQILKDFAGTHLSDLVTTPPEDAPGWKDALAANDAGQAKTPVPVFLYQGDADQVIPVSVSATLLQKYCALGDTAWRKTYPGADHTSVIAAALGDITTYINDRVAGQPAPSSC